MSAFYFQDQSSSKDGTILERWIYFQALCKKARAQSFKKPKKKSTNPNPLKPQEVISIKFH